MLRFGCLGLLLLDIVWLFMRLKLGNTLATPGLGCLGFGSTTNYRFRLVYYIDTFSLVRLSRSGLASCAVKLCPVEGFLIRYDLFILW